MDYKEQYLHPKWQKKRLEIMKRDGFKCVSCGDGESKLNVHHNYYINSKDVWDYPQTALITVCDICHKNIHKSMEDEELNKNIPISRIAFLTRTTMEKCFFDYQFYMGFICSDLINRSTSNGIVCNLDVIDIIENAILNGLNGDQFSTYWNACEDAGSILNINTEV